MLTVVERFSHVQRCKNLNFLLDSEMFTPNNATFDLGYLCGSSGLNHLYLDTSSFPQLETYEWCATQFALFFTTEFVTTRSLPTPNIVSGKLLFQTPMIIFLLNAPWKTFATKWRSLQEPQHFLQTPPTQGSEYGGPRGDKCMLKKAVPAPPREFFLGPVPSRFCNRSPTPSRFCNCDPPRRDFVTRAPPCQNVLFGPAPPENYQNLIVFQNSFVD